MSPSPLLRHGRLPRIVQLALADDEHLRGALVFNPLLDATAVERLYGHGLSTHQGVRLAWRDGLDAGVAERIASHDGRVDVVVALCSSAEGRAGLDAAAAAGTLAAMSPSAAAVVSHRGGRTAAEAVGGMLSLPDAVLWLMRRYTTLDVAVASAALAAAAGNKGRRSWLASEVDAVVAERGVMAEALLASGHGTLARLACAAADLGSDEVAEQGGAEQLVERMLAAIEELDAGWVKAACWRELAARLDVPTGLRARARALLAAHDASDRRCALPDALAVDWTIDWRRDEVSDQQLDVLLELPDRRGRLRDAWRWQLVAALRNPRLSADQRRRVGAELDAVLGDFGALEERVRRLIETGPQGDDHVLLRAGANWSPGGNLPGSARNLAKRYGPPAPVAACGGDPTAFPQWVQARGGMQQVLDADAIDAVRWRWEALSVAATAVLGDDVGAWRMLLELSEGFDGTLAELLDVAALMAVGEPQVEQ